MNRELAKKIINKAFERGLTSVDEWNTLDIYASDYELYYVGKQPDFPYVTRWGVGTNVNFVTTSKKQQTLMRHHTIVDAIYKIFSVRKLKDAIEKICKENFTSPLRFAVCDISNELTNKYSVDNMTFSFDLYDICDCLLSDTEDDVVKKYIGSELLRRGAGVEYVKELIAEENVEKLAEILSSVKNTSCKTLDKWAESLAEGNELKLFDIGNKDFIITIKKVAICDTMVVLVYYNGAVYFLRDFNGDNLWALLYN